MENLSPINDDKDIVNKGYVDAVKSAAAVNRSTLGYSGKNLLKLLYVTGHTGGWSGKLFTFNSDGGITVSGTATAEMAFTISKIHLYEGRYILSSSTGFNLQLYLNGKYVKGYWVDNNGVEIIITEANTYEFKWWHGSGTSISTTIYPMLRLADITDDTYEPYVPDVNTRLLALEDKQAQSGALLAETSIGSVSGSITIADLANYNAAWAYIDGTVNGVTFATNVIIPIAYLAKSTSNSVKLAGGIPTAAYITSSGPQAPADTSGYITASVSGNTLSLSLSTATDVIGNVKIVAI